MRKAHCRRVNENFIQVIIPGHKGILTIKTFPQIVAKYWGKTRPIEETEEALWVYLPTMKVRLMYEGEIPTAEFEEETDDRA